MNRAGNDHRPRRPRDPHAALLERLAQHLEHVPAELRHFVEKQHAVMREADLARPRLLAAADERDVRDRVMRRAERPLGDQAVPGGEQAGDRVDGRDLERLVEDERRQDPATRRAIIVLPEPGGPTISVLWPPAAAISSARRASACP